MVRAGQPHPAQKHEQPIIGGVPRYIAYCIPAESAKIVHLVRHGQGFHNVEAALYGQDAYKKKSLLDARLDETGRGQCVALGERVRATRMQVDVVLVSPLTRTLETATLIFEKHATRPPFVAVELCREAFGAHPCDQRRPVSVVKPEFAHVDFSGVETDADTWADPARRETVREVQIRCDKFLEVLRHRTERNIVVVSHGVFLETLLSRCQLHVPPNTELANRRFENCEMRSIVIGGWQ